MYAHLPDFRITLPRLSPGVLTAVVLAHLGVLAAILALPKTPPSLIPPRPLYVQLIEPTAVSAPADALLRPPPSAPAIPAPVVATPLALPPPETRIARTVPPPARPDTPRPDPQLAPSPITAPLPAPAPAPAPAAAAREAPPPAPAAPPLPVTQPRFNADYLDNPKPPYPGLSRRMGEEGEVQLRVQVDANGNAQQVELYRSSGFPRLDQTALDTVSQWRFVPARQGDQPVPAWVIVPIKFSLN